MVKPQEWFWMKRFVRCLQHGDTCCYVQMDGSHRLKRECTCSTADPYLCPIDAHSVPWLIANPMFEAMQEG